MKRAEYEHTGFGKWKWVDKEYCDRCGREVVVPWEAHRNVFDYECLDSGCYTAVRNGQDKNRSEPLRHFVGALTPTHTQLADVLNSTTEAAM
jgi:hypothetical protein